MIRRIALLLAALLLLLPLTACNSGDKSGYIVRYDFSARPRTLDPQLATSAESLLLLENTFEGLLRQGADGELVPGVAISYTASEDGLVYTFALRRDALWNDGETPVTAHDFVFAFRRVLDPSTGSPNAPSFLCIKNARQVLEGSFPSYLLGVRAADDYTFEVTLEAATPFFIGLTASAAAMPCNEAFFQSTKGRYGSEPRYLLFNGPFYIRGFEDKRITLRGNGSYQGARPRVAGGVNLTYQTADQPDPENPSATLQSAEQKVYDRFRTGKTDAAPLSYANYQKLAQQEGITAFSFENTVWGLQLNCNSNTYGNEKIRRAFRMVIDTTELESLLTASLSPAHALVPPAVKLLDRSYRSVAGEDLRAERNLEQARVLLAEGLAELGVDKLSRTSILCPDTDGFNALLSVVQRQLQETLGVFVNLEPMPVQQLNSAVASGDYLIALAPITAGANSPENVLGRFSSLSPQNRSGFENAEYDNLLQRAATATTVTECVIYYSRAERLLMEDGVFLPIAFETSYYASAKGMNDLIFSPFSYQVFFKYAYHDKGSN